MFSDHLGRTLSKRRLVPSNPSDTEIPRLSNMDMRPIMPSRNSPTMVHVSDSSVTSNLAPLIRDLASKSNFQLHGRGTNNMMIKAPVINHRLSNFG